MLKKTRHGRTKKLNNSPEDYFRDSYDDIMYTGTVGMYSTMVHKLMERPYVNMKAPRILELGAGKGQHRAYVKSFYDEYIEGDRDPELLGLDNVDARLQRIQLDAEDLSIFPDNSFDRVIATCLLAHLDNPEEALEEWKRVLKPGGYLTIYVPAEPGILLRAGRFLVVAPKSKRLGQDHYGVVYRDHRNHYPGMREMIRTVYAEDRIHRVRFPFDFLGWNFAVFDIFHIRKK